MGKVIIFSAPSGSGKTTIVKELLARYPQLEFSISATSRARAVRSRTAWTTTFFRRRSLRRPLPRSASWSGRRSTRGTCYGTLRSEVERIWAKGHVIVFDVDVLGASTSSGSSATRPARSSSWPPRSRRLRRRLVARGTDAPEAIERRVAKAEFELTKAPEFDHVVVNYRLDDAVARASEILGAFIAR